jgi:hypothetical protein
MCAVLSCWLDTPARDSLMCCVWPQPTLRMAGSTWCSRRPARSCGCPFTTIWWVRWRAGAATPSLQTPKGEAYNTDRFQAAWTRLTNGTPAGRIREDGYTFHGLRASSVEKLREAGCNAHEIESITGMSPAMIMRYSRFADQKKLAKSAQRRLKERTSSERGA